MYHLRQFVDISAFFTFHDNMNNFPTKPYRETHRRDFNKDYLGTSEEKCRQRLLQKLADLKDSGQLKESLLPQVRPSRYPCFPVLSHSPSPN